MSTLSLRLPESLHKAIKELVREENVSINQFVTTAVAEKLSALKTVDYLRERADRADVHDFQKILDLVPDVEPDECDVI